MNHFEKLELNVDTLRELSDDQLSQVAGGAISGAPCQINTGNITYYVPSQGGAWTMNCNALTTV
jgi:hypothetical protein